MGRLQIIEEIIEVGVRKVFKQGPGRPAIYLPKSLSPLIGRRVIVIVKVLKEVEDREGERKASQGS